MIQAPSAVHPIPLDTTTGLNHRKVLMWVFLGSDCMFFGSLIATYLLYRGRSLVGPYPHEVFNIPYTSISAFVLLMSSLTMVLALAAIQRGDLRSFKVWLLATALLGAVFLGGQYFEFTTFVNEGLTLRTNLFGSTFFVLTGFHGAHVTIGVIILLSFFVVAMRGRLRLEQHLNIELAGLWGLSVIADQQIAGLIMKVPGALTFMVVLVVVFFTWYNLEERGETKKGVEKHPEDVWPSAGSASGR